MKRTERLRKFVVGIWQWYDNRKRTLPWRDLEIPDDGQRAYMILVSEVMLQQTQVSRVQVLFPRFLRRFPTIHHLSRASNRDVLVAWRGMGYNGRALRLRDASRALVARGVGIRVGVRTKNKQNKHRLNPNPNPNPSFPCSMEELMAIPGIGPYTAAAIRNFAFNIPTPCVDVNIGRILRRVFGVEEKKTVEGKAEEVLSIASDAKNWHAALMDFGSLVCAKKNPLCSQCPLSQGICKSAFRVPPFDTTPARFIPSDGPESLRVTRGGPKNEPGRIIAGRFVPNRITRGKIIDLLRDHPQGLSLITIGRLVCSDWSTQHHRWLQDIIAKLQRERFLEKRKGKYILG